MAIRELERRLEKLEASSVSSADDLFASLGAHSLVDLYLQTASNPDQDEANDGRPIRWPESVAQPTQDEVQHARERFLDLAQRSNSHSACQALSTRELLILAIRDE